MSIIIQLYTEVSERLIGFSHTVRILFFLERSAFAFACRYNLIGQFVGHATAITLAAVTDQPFHAQRDLTVGANFRRDLERCTTDAAATNFHRRGNVREGTLPNLISIFAGLLGYLIQRVVKNGKGYTLFSLPHDVVDKTSDQLVVELGVWCEREFLGLCFPHDESDIE